MLEKKTETKNGTRTTTTTKTVHTISFSKEEQNEMFFSRCMQIGRSGRIKFLPYFSHAKWIEFFKLKKK